MEVFAWHEGLGKLIEIANSGIFRPEMVSGHLHTALLHGKMLTSFKLEAMGLPKDLVVFG